MNQRVQAIYTAIEFIESRLKEDIAVADIAVAAGYSLYHFIRTFNQTVQHTPYDYLMRRRLSQAALALLKDDRRVIDIALDFQFKNPETFTRAFRRILGMPPTRWREQGFADPRDLMPALDRDYLDYLNAPDFAPPRLVSLEQDIVLAGLMAPLTADPRWDPRSLAEPQMDFTRAAKGARAARFLGHPYPAPNFRWNPLLSGRAQNPLTGVRSGSLRH